ncbi:MAG: outer membrane protein [Xanthobacteraceae bacterium]
MKKLILSVAVLALGAVSASAADLAPRPYTKAPVLVSPVYDWSGFYVGLNGGYGWSDYGVSNFTTGVALGSQTATGGVAGGQFGWRTQSGWLVWGLDFQGDWASLKGSGAGGLAGGGNNNIQFNLFPLTINSKMSDFGIIAATAGYAANNVLFYAKAGAAFTTQTFTSVTAGGFVFDGQTETRWGAALGAGIEYGITANWTVALEYDHLFMGSVDDSMLAGGVGPAVTRVLRISQDVDLVTARINYKFGGPVVARY